MTEKPRVEGEHMTSNPIVQAQHQETGRMWEGQRDQIPRGYTEVDYRPSEEILACPKCGELPFQSADMEFVHPKSNEFRSLYYWRCLEEDCCFQGPKSYSNEQSGKNWNSAVQEYKAYRQAQEDAFHARLP